MTKKQILKHFKLLGLAPFISKRLACPPWRLKSIRLFIYVAFGKGLMSFQVGVSLSVMTDTYSTSEGRKSLYTYTCIVTGDEQDTPTQKPTPKDTVTVIVTKSGKYHHPSCRHLKKAIKPQRMLRKEAVRKGKATCKVCKPNI